MKFINLVPELQFCSGVLEKLPTLKQHGPLFKFCASGLRVLADHAAEYDREINESIGFVKHFKLGLQELAFFLENNQTNTLEDLNHVYERSFALVEELAIFMREKHLRSACQPGNTVCHNLLEYFESSGHWRPGDGTMVTEQYYVILPVATMRGLINEMTGVAANRKSLNT